MAYSKLSSLHPPKEDWVVQVRLCRMWEAINFKNANALLGLELVLADAEGDSIQAFIRRIHIRKFKGLLKEGQLYDIANFKVSENHMDYKVVPNKHRICFGPSTIISEPASSPVDIPLDVFNFVPAEVHQQRINDHSLLTDIVGCLVGASEVVHLENEKKSVKRVLELSVSSTTDRVMTVTLWGKLAEGFDYTPYTGDGAHVILAITSLTVKKIEGELAFTSTTASRSFFNPAIPETNAIRSRFAGNLPNIRVLQSQRFQQVSLAEQKVVNRKTITEILEMAWTSDNQVQEQFVTVVAEVVGIDESWGWFYVSCNVCKKKVTPVDGVFPCKECNKECLYPIIAYKIHLNVSDSVDGTTFVLFNYAAEKLFNSPASKYVAQMGVGSKQIPKAIKDLVGRSFIFKLKLTYHNLKDGMENYTVVKLFDADEKPICESSVSTPSSPDPAKVVESPKKRDVTMMSALVSSEGPCGASGSAVNGGKISVIEKFPGLDTPDKKEYKKAHVGR